MSDKDTIYRQAAIDAVNDVLAEYIPTFRPWQCRLDPGKGERMTKEEAINELLQCYSLYSPFKTAKKTNEAISMAIKTLDKDINVPNKSALDHIHNVVRDDAYKRGYEQGKADAAPKWIPVSKRLPDDDTIVQVTFANGRVGNSSWHKTNTYNNGFDAVMHGITKDDKVIHFGVVAWKPLPEPYEEGLDELKKPPQAPAIPLARIDSYIKAYKLLELIANALPFEVIETMVEILEQGNPGGKRGGDNGKT